MKKSGKGNLRHIHLDVAGNGYSISHHKQAPPPKEGPGGMMQSDMDGHMKQPQPHLAMNRQEALKHMDDLLSEHEGDNGEEAGSPTDEMNEHPMRKLSRRRHPTTLRY